MGVCGRMLQESASEVSIVFEIPLATWDKFSNSY